MDPSTLNPVAIFLAKKGGGGDRVLFRYPYSVPNVKRNIIDGRKESATDKGLSMVNPRRRRNPYALSHRMLTEDLFNQNSLSNPGKECESLNADNLSTFSNKVLSNLLAAHPSLCDNKFELKINDIRFVGHPLSLTREDPEEARYYANPRKTAMTLFHVVFALKATASYSVVQLYHDLSMLIARAIRNEEHRVGYLDAEAKTMSNAQDEVKEEGQISPFRLCLDRSELAQHLKQIFEEMTDKGEVYVRINNYIEINFCNPQKVFYKLNPNLLVEQESIFDCIEFIKPYHTFLLLYEPKEIFKMFPLDASPAVYRLVREADPTMSFRMLASHTNLTVKHVWEIAGHLLYWGKATIIYPICENNVYVISPKIEDIFVQKVKDQFEEKFPGERFASWLAKFSEPTSIAHHQHFHNPGAIQMLGRIIVFFLRHHLIVQLHTYVTLLVNTKSFASGLEDPVAKKYGLPWSVARHLGDESAAQGAGGDQHVIEGEMLNLPEPSIDAPCPPDYSSYDEIAEDFASGLEEMDLLDPQMPFSKNSDTIAENAKNIRREVLAQKPSQLSNQPEVDPVIPHELNEFQGDDIPDISTENETDPNIILKAFDEDEKQMIMALPGAQHIKDLRLFARLAPYFSGRYHIEEILFFANVRRSDLHVILDLFSSIIALHEHEDTAITSFYDISLKSCK